MSGEVDVRSGDQLRAFADQVAAELGRIDILVANAGIFAPAALLHEMDEDTWDDMIAVT